MIIAISGKIGSGKDTVGDIIQYLTSTRTYDKSFVEWNNLKNSKDYKDGLWYKGYSKWQIKKFADSLKAIVCILIGCTREQLEDRKFKDIPLREEWWKWKLPNGNFVDYNQKSTPILQNEDTLIKLTPRLLMQLLGTECGREIIHPNIWINCLFKDYKYPDSIKSPYDLIDIEYWIGVQAEELLPKWIITDVRFKDELEACKKRSTITIRVNRNNNKQNSHISETELDNEEFNYNVDNNGTIENLVEQVKNILIKEKII